MHRLEYQLFHRRHLPHFQPPGATLFVTFRLAGSLPAEMLAELAQEAERIEHVLRKIADPAVRVCQADRAQRYLFGKWDRALQASTASPFYLQDPRIAAIVAESLHYRDKQVYDLHAFCVMPNHVHVVCTPRLGPDGTYYALSAIMHSLKRYTARQANQLLGRQGAFWHHESYDHVVRDEAEFRRIIEYVINNPVSAGLVSHWEDWEWTYISSQWS